MELTYVKRTLSSFWYIQSITITQIILELLK